VYEALLVVVGLVVEAVCRLRKALVKAVGLETDIIERLYEVILMI
jgi:hypothetical protein